MKFKLWTIVNLFVLVTLMVALADPNPVTAAPSQAGLVPQVIQAIFTVTNTSDSGPGSLRQAILDANSNTGVDTITFAIGATGSPQTIQPASALPVISDPVLIDGWSQGGSGYTGSPLIEINGALAGNNIIGLNITAGNSTVRGLLINGFIGGSFTAGIRLQTGGNNWVYGNYIGTNFAGDTRVANQRGIWIDNGSSNNRIGTNADSVDDTAERNVISSNIDQNIWIYQPTTTGNKIMGNYIGLNASGTSAVGTNNQTVAAAGILVQESSYTVIGTDGDGQGDAFEGNVISGSILNINLTGTSNLNESHNNRISGNLIGTNANGTAGVGIQVEGVRVYVAYDTVIGTNGDGISDELEGNLISGNSDFGIMLQQTGALNNVIAGNKIGTDITGMVAIPNGTGGSPRAGIMLGGHGNRIGTNSDGLSDDLERNLISGNTQVSISAIYFNNLPNPDAQATIIAGNWMGVDATGVSALPNNYGISGTSYEPVILRDNVIAAHTLDGISTNSSNMLLTGNRIGVGADGVTLLGNGHNGMLLSGDNNIIGGTGPGEANIIANNGTVALYYSGVRISNTGQSNTIRGNSIYANSQLGIDLRWPDGVNANDDDDADTGGNNLQNYPVLSAAMVQGANVMVTGTLNSNANTTFTLDFYTNSTCDTSGHGEGELYLGTGQVITDVSGDASFEISVASFAANGDFISATATHSDGSTSEFSMCVVVVGEIPISGLQASNNGPTQLGYSTQFSATQIAGTGVSYAWDFGDGTSATGATPAHTYDAVGEYSAVVTATNTFGSAEADTTVTILPPPACTATHNHGVTLFSSSNATAVQQAVDAATTGDSVKIAGNCAGVTPWNGSYQTVFINKALSLEGGYTAGNWDTPDPLNTPTTLDALSLGRVVFINAVVEVVIENLTLTNGNSGGSATGNCPGYGCGGGLFTYGSLNLNQVIIRNSTANRGGGAYITGGLIAIDTDWLNNTGVSQRGGALELYGDASLSGGLLQGNTALYGGAIFAEAGLVINSTQFIDNTAISPSVGSGGAIHAAGITSITGARFEGNRSYTGAGAIITLGTDTTIVDSEFVNNRALNTSAQGGALYASGTTTISGSSFQDNQAGSNGTGGAIVVYRTTTIEGSTFNANTAGSQGGAIYHWGLSEPGNTGLIYPLVLSNSLLVGNQAGAEGGGLYFRRGFSTTNTPVQITGTTFETNTAALDGGGAYLGQPANMSGSLFEGNQSTTAAGGGLYSEDRLEINLSHFQGNTANRGGGAYITGGLTAIDTDWLNNTGVSQRGGAFEVYGDASLSGGLMQSNIALYGGAIFADGSLEINSTHFIDNTATGPTSGSGGAIYATGITGITGARFEGNRSYTGAGAVLALGTDTTIVDSEFVDNRALNTAAQGGALHASGTTTISGSSFQDNQAGSNGTGGAIVVFITTTIEDSTFTANTAGGQGGAIYHWGLSEPGNTGNIYPLVLSNSLLVGNQAGAEGGGLYFRRGFTATNTPVQITSTTFDTNSAVQGGGGAYLAQPVELTGSVFLRNASQNTSGGGVSLDGGSYGAHSRVINSVFAGNIATSGAVIHVVGLGQVDVLHTTLASTTLSPARAITVNGPNVFITNTMVVNHTVGIELDSGAVSSTRTLFSGNQTDIQGGVANQEPVYGDPNFLDSVNDDYHLTLGSAAIDAASDAGIFQDMDGDIRPIIGDSDIGADEFGSSSLVDPGETTTISVTVNPSRTITVWFPRGALSDPRFFRLLPLQEPSVPVSLERSFAGLSFLLQPDPQVSTQLQHIQFDTPFLLPIDITLEYNESDLAGNTENNLYLAVLDEGSGEWVDASTTCSTPSMILREPDQNRLRVSTCATGAFALLDFLSEEVFLFLPLITR